MRQRKGEPVDPRSTQRKRARIVLAEAGVPYICNECGRSPIKLPDGLKRWDLELAPVELRTNIQLEANHINKNIMDNDLANLEWLCSRDHKNKDKQTAKGVSTKEFDDTGYLEGFI